MNARARPSATAPGRSCSRNGRQYPDGPLEPPPGRMVYSPLTGRQRPDVVAEVESWAWSALGDVMHSLLNPEPQPGPPYVHTFVPPRPCPTECDEDCELTPLGCCHERHKPSWKRDHDPGRCEQMQRSGPAITMTTAGGEGMGGDD